MGLPAIAAEDPRPKPSPTPSADSGWAGDVNSTGNFWADLGQAISDPVNSVNGEFYVNDVDLTIPGPFPFELRRNYTSLNTFANELGYGWKSGLFPYLVVGPSEWVIHAAEPDGSVIAYEKKGADLWQPTLVKNPNWVNSNGSSSGSAGNLFNAKITRTVGGNGTVYTLDGVDGSRRVFRERSFPNGGGLQRTRPYLESWHDDRGNGWMFTFGTDPLENGYGVVARMDSTGGASVVFSYDSAGRVTAAVAGDGRRADYTYDEHGDLVQVVRADSSIVQYAYGRESGGTVSNHLLIRETKPEGRVLENDYDGSRRVVEQRATVGEGTQLVRNATFIYNQTTETDGSKTGHTLVRDAYNREGRYDYVKSQLTRVRDPLGLETLQTWYAAGDTTAGAYPRSLKRRTDKRGTISDFSYDAFGNLLSVTVTGDRTGDGTAEMVTTSTAYNALHLPVEVILPGGRRTVMHYEDANFPRLVTTIEAYAGDLVTRTRRVYGDVGPGSVAAKGMLLSETRAFGFEDAAETVFSYTPAGFLLSTTQATGSGDPSVVRTFGHNARGEMVEEADALGRTVRYTYDGLGRRTGTEFRDEAGALVGWAYQTFDGNGELVWSNGPRTNPEDQVSRTYDRAGRLVEESRSRSVASASGNGTEAAPPAITQHRYNLFGNLVETTLPDQSVVSMTHDANGRMTQRVVRDASANLLAQESWTYEPGDQIATHTDPLGGVTTNLYTSDGQIKSVTRPDGTVLEWRYQLDGRPVREPVTHNTAWHVSYDDAARTVTRTLKALDGATLATESETFDRRGNRISATDVDSHTFTATFDGLDRPKTATGPAASGSSAQQVTTYSYDAAGRVTTVANSSGESVVTTRDVMGRMVSMEVSGPNGIARLTGYEYSPDHNSVTVTEGSGPGAIATQTWTDTFGQTVLMRHADGSFRSSVFDVAGRLVSSTDELGHTTTYLHDGLGRMTRETLPDGAVTNFTYNAAGNLTGRLMPGGLNWTATYDTAGRIIGETLTGGGQTTRQFAYTYHPAGAQKGLLNTVADPRGITRTITYDAFRRPQTIAATGSQPWHNLTVAMTYDNRGNPLTITRTGGDQPDTTINRAVDGYGQIASESVSLGGQPLSTITHTWDGVGRRSGLDSGTGFQPVFQHNAAGQLTSTTVDSLTASFAYGTNGLLDSRTSPFRSQSVTSRDSRGRVLGQNASVNDVGILSEGMTWRADSTMGSYTAIRSGLHAWNESKAFAYNNRGQLLSESFSPWDDASRTINYQFDMGTPGVGVRTKAEVGSGGNTNWFVNASTVNPLARITGESANNLLRTIPATGIAFGADRVEADINGVLFGDATHPGWADATGAWSINLLLPPGENRLTVRAVHPSRWKSDPATSTFTVTGQPQTISTAHDEVGNVISRTWSGGKSQTLTWDAENRLIEVVQSGGGETAFTWTAAYDALGRRLQTTYTPSGGSAFTTTSIYDPLVTHLEIGVVVNGTANWKVYGPDLNGTYGGLHGTGGLEWMTSGGQSVGIINDSFGNALASATATGVTWQTTKVGAYGPLPTSRMLTVESGASLAQATAWRGDRIDPTGSIQLGVRPYDPAGGRFLSADPMGHGASMSLYCFANGDPVNFHDPDGYLAVGAWDMTTSVLGNPYVSGSLRTVGGLAEASAGVAFGAATSWTGVGAVGGGLVAMHGVDQAWAGIRTITTGQHQSSLTSMGIQLAGVSQPYAELIDGSISIAGSSWLAFTSRALVAKDTSAALSTFRYTVEGETFFHYGYAKNAVRFDAGLRPGGFATTISNLTGAEARAGLALPSSGRALPDAIYTVKPLPRTWVRVNPVADDLFDQPGGLPEFEFPLGTAPSTVSPPRLIR